MRLGEKVAPDPDIERAFEWILSFMRKGEWERRRAAIEEYIEEIIQPKPSLREANQHHRLNGTDDKIGWYLYLVETAQHTPTCTEVLQASRVLPIFMRLGKDLDLVRQLGGIERQIEKLLGAAKKSPDGVLFEVLVALLWARNGWDKVSFIPAHAKEKRPDIHAVKGKDEWFVETKRMSTSSTYSLKEREKWLRMWNHLKSCLIEKEYAYVLDITFHVELETLSDDFVRDQLEHKLKFVVGPCQLISNETWDVSIKPVDFAALKNHFEDSYVKSESRKLQELIGGTWDRRKGFTFVMDASHVRIGGERGLNRYVEDIRWVAASYWSCDAERAIESKARDIRGHLADAVNQLPKHTKSAIHIGLETFDGEAVEAERYWRIMNTVSTFDAKDKDLRWIYAHLFESYAPPDRAWTLDETIYLMSKNMPRNADPLSSCHNTILPEEASRENTAHWLREAP